MAKGADGYYCRNKPDEAGLTLRTPQHDKHEQTGRDLADALEAVHTLLRREAAFRRTHQASHFPAKSMSQSCWN